MILISLIFPQFSEAAPSIRWSDSELPGIVDRPFSQSRGLAMITLPAGIGDAAHFSKAIEEPKPTAAGATARAVINICNRTGEVRDAVLQLIPNENDCRKVPCLRRRFVGLIRG